MPSFAKAKKQPSSPRSPAKSREPLTPRSSGSALNATTPIQAATTTKGPSAKRSSIKKGFFGRSRSNSHGLVAAEKKTQGGGGAPATDATDENNPPAASSSKKGRREKKQPKASNAAAKSAGKIASSGKPPAGKTKGNKTLMGFEVTDETLAKNTTKSSSASKSAKGSSTPFPESAVRVPMDEQGIENSSESLSLGKNSTRTNRSARSRKSLKSTRSVKSVKSVKSAKPTKSAASGKKKSEVSTKKPTAKPAAKLPTAAATTMPTAKPPTAATSSAGQQAIQTEDVAPAPAPPPTPTSPSSTSGKKYVSLGQRMKLGSPLSRKKKQQQQQKEEEQNNIKLTAARGCSLPTLDTVCAPCAGHEDLNSPLACSKEDTVLTLMDGTSEEDDFVVRDSKEVDRIEHSDADMELLDRCAADNARCGSKLVRVHNGGKGSEEEAEEESMLSRAAMFLMCGTAACVLGDETVHSAPTPGNKASSSIVGLGMEELGNVKVTATRSWPRTRNDVRRDVDSAMEAARKEAAAEARLIAEKEAAAEMARVNEKTEMNLVAKADELKWMQTNLDAASELAAKLQGEIATLEDNLGKAKASREKDAGQFEETTRDYERATKRIERMSKELEDTEEKLRTESQTNWTLNSHVAGLKQDIADARAKQAEMERVKNQAVEVARQAAEEEKTRRASRATELERLAAESEQNGALKTQILALKKRIAEGKEEQSAARVGAAKDNEDVEQRIALMEWELEMERKLVTSTEEALEKTNEHLTSVQGRYDTEAQAVVILQDELKSKMEELADIESSREDTTEATAMKGLDEGAVIQIKALKAQAERLKTELKAANDTATKSEERMRAYEAKIQSMQGDLIETTSFVEENESKLAALKGDLSIEVAADGSIENEKSPSDLAQRTSLKGSFSPKAQKATGDQIGSPKSLGDRQRTMNSEHEELKLMEKVIDGLKMDVESPTRTKSDNSQPSNKTQEPGLLLEELDVFSGEIGISHTNTAEEEPAVVELEYKEAAQSLSEQQEDDGEDEDDETISSASSVSITSINIGKKKVGWFRKFLGVADEEDSETNSVSTMGNRSESTFGGSTFAGSTRKKGFMRSRSKKWRRNGGTPMDLSTMDSYYMSVLSENTGRHSDASSSAASSRGSSIRKKGRKPRRMSSSLAPSETGSVGSDEFTKGGDDETYSNSISGTFDDASLIETAGRDVPATYSNALSETFDSADSSDGSEKMTDEETDAGDTFSSEGDNNNANPKSPAKKSTSLDSAVTDRSSSSDTMESASKNAEGEEKEGEGEAGGGIASWFKPSPLSPMGRAGSGIAFLVQ